MLLNIFLHFDRIQYREEQIQRKLEERRLREEEKDQEELEKEYRLEALREKVFTSRGVKAKRLHLFQFSLAFKTLLNTIIFVGIPIVVFDKRTVCWSLIFVVSKL